MSRTLIDSGIDWIGRIPSDWQIVKNKFLLQSIYSGGTPTTTNEKLYNEDGISFVSIGDMTNKDYVYYTNKHLTDEGIKDKNLKVLPEGTILYSIYASVGFTSELRIPATISQAILALNINNKVEKRFYKYSLDCMRKSVLSDSNGNTQLNLNAEKVKNFLFALPTKEEQKRIADYLDNKCSKIDKVIEDNNNSIVLLEEYKSSVISESVFLGIKNLHFEKKNSKNFGTIPVEWDDVNIKSIFSFKKGLSITKENLIETGIPVISYGQIHSKNNDGTKVREELIRYVPDVYMSSNEKALTYNKDIIFADTSEDLDGAGNCIYIDTNYPIFAGYHTIIASPKTEITKYFAYLFKTEKWRSQVRASVYGVKLFSITQKILKNCNVLVPSLEEQKEIVDYLEKKCSNIDKVIEYRKKIIEKLEEYKKSLIYEVVTGKKEV